MEIETTVAAKILGRPLPPVRPFEIPARDYVELNLRAGNDMVFWSHIWELGRKNVLDEEGRKHYVDGNVSAPTPVNSEVKVHHYSRVVRLENVENHLFALS